MGHVTMDNRHGLVVATRYTQATGKAEREAALEMAKSLKRRRKGRKTVGADKGYDTTDFVEKMHRMTLIAPVPSTTGRRVIVAILSANGSGSW